VLWKKGVRWGGGGLKNRKGVLMTATKSTKNGRIIGNCQKQDPQSPSKKQRCPKKGNKPCQGGRCERKRQNAPTEEAQTRKSHRDCGKAGGAKGSRKSKKKPSQGGGKNKKRSRRRRGRIDLRFFLPERRGSKKKGVLKKSKKCLRKGNEREEALKQRGGKQSLYDSTLGKPIKSFGETMRFDYRVPLWISNDGYEKHGGKKEKSKLGKRHISRKEVNGTLHKKKGARGGGKEQRKS